MYIPPGYSYEFALGRARFCQLLICGYDDIKEDPKIIIIVTFFFDRVYQQTVVRLW